MKRIISFILLAVLLSGSGVHSVSVKTDPPGAKVYSSDSYVGVSPCNVPADYNFLWGETVSLKMEKPGYKTKELNITTEELKVKEGTSESIRGSEFGDGYTFPYTFTLEKE